MNPGDALQKETKIIQICLAIVQRFDTPYKAYHECINPTNMQFSFLYVFFSRNLFAI